MLKENPDDDDPDTGGGGTSLLTHISAKQNEASERKISDQQLLLGSQFDPLPIKLLPTFLLVVMASTSPITVCDLLRRHGSNRGDIWREKQNFWLYPAWGQKKLWQRWLWIHAQSNCILQRALFVWKDIFRCWLAAYMWLKKITFRSSVCFRGTLFWTICSRERHAHIRCTQQKDLPFLRWQKLHAFDRLRSYSPR